MKTRLVCLPPGQLAPGMTVAAAVTSAQGGVLLAAGTVLDETVLENLRRRGVGFVSVAISDSRDEVTVERELRAAAERVEFIFRGQGSSAREALRATVNAYRMKQLA